jgi:hypothetical protein
MQKQISELKLYKIISSGQVLFIMYPYIEIK